MENNIKDIREERGMTQDELARTSKVSRTVISQLESGARDIITSETMLKISKGLGRPVDEIFLL